MIVIIVNIIIVIALIFCLICIKPKFYKILFLVGGVYIFLFLIFVYPRSSVIYHLKNTLINDNYDNSLFVGKVSIKSLYTNNLSVNMKYKGIYELVLTGKDDFNYNNDTLKYNLEILGDSKNINYQNKIVNIGFYFDENKQKIYESGVIHIIHNKKMFGEKKIDIRITFIESTIKDKKYNFDLILRPVTW